MKLSQARKNRYNPPSFYDEEPCPEVLEGIFAEGDIFALGGEFHVGKTPLTIDLIVCIVRGLDWCGLKTSRRPVIVMDYESPSAKYKKNVRYCAERRGVDPPDEREEIDLYLMRSSAAKNANTRALLDAKGKGFDILLGALRKKPRALVVFDPGQMVLEFDGTKSKDVNKAYKQLRLIGADFPHASFCLTFNTRKHKPGYYRPGLLNDPHLWLEEVSGSLDLMNRCDLRLGIDFLDDNKEIRVINGIYRNEDMPAFLVKPVPHKDGFGGFEAVTANDAALAKTLTPKQFQYWQEIQLLPQEFSFDDGVKICRSKGMFSRLSQALMKLCRLQKSAEGRYKRL
jgi:hypothetical protein